MSRRPIPSALRIKLGHALLLVLLLTTPLLSQEAGERLCGACKTTGKVAFEVPPRLALESEAGTGWETLFCSAAIASDNMALSWAPCKRCKTPSVQRTAQAEWDAIHAENDAWLAERRKVDQLVGAGEMVHVETTHVVVSWNVPKMTVGKKAYRMHEAAHLYARRMEEFYRRFQDLFGVEDANNLRNKHYVFAFEKLSEALAAGAVYVGLTGGQTVKRAGGASHESAIVTWYNRNEHPTDEDFHRHWLHSMTHQLSSVYYDVRWFPPGTLGLMPPWLNDKYGWLDEGLAHWFEMQFDGQAATYCIREQDNTLRWQGQDWRKNVWKAVTAGEPVSFPEVSTKPTQALSAQEHQFAWSWIDYLMANRDTKAMGKAIELAKREKSARDILKEAYDLTTLQLESAWAEWVKTAYAPSKDEPIDPRRQRRG